MPRCRRHCGDGMSPEFRLEFRQKRIVAAPGALASTGSLLQELCYHLLEGPLADSVSLNQPLPRLAGLQRVVDLPRFVLGFDYVGNAKGDLVASPAELASTSVYWHVGAIFLQWSEIGR